MKAPHILLISLETIRRDHLRRHGYAKDLAPHLDRLMAGGAYCTDAVANCGWTLPQNITLHTGLYPLTHDLTLLREQHPIFPEHATLAEHLQAHGYQTFAGVNERNPYSAHAKYGFDRGFDELNAGAVYNQHMQWTEEFALTRFRDHHAAGPCFVYLHVNDTHEPWDAPAPWDTMWGDSYHSRYEGDITYADYYLGRIFAGLEEMGIFDETLVVVAGDHGTEFWEHGFREKKVNVYNEILHIPLMFHCPTLLPAGAPVPGLAESAQIAPTTVELAGLPPLPTAQGASLAPRLRGEATGGLDYVCTHTRHENQREGGSVQFDHYAIQTLHHKFIRLEIHADIDTTPSDWKYRMQMIAVRCRVPPESIGPGTVLREFYNLQTHPEEGFNLLPEADAETLASATALESQLDAWISDCIAARPGTGG